MAKISVHEDYAASAAAVWRPSMCLRASTESRSGRVSKPATAAR